MLANFDSMHLENRMANGTAKVKQYPYRTAQPINYLFEIPRDAELEDDLALHARAPKDNHTLYEISFEDGTGIVILCSDRVMNIGCGVNLRDW